MAVRKRKWTTANGEVREGWQADYYDDEGNRQRKLFRTKKEADSFVAKARTELDKGVHVPDRASITLAEAAKQWIARAEAESLEGETIRHYRQHVDQHIVPLTDLSKRAWQGKFGDHKLSKLSPPIIEAFRLTVLSKTSPAMARKLVSTLKMILNAAVRRGQMPFNPAQSVQMRDDKRHKRKVTVGVDIPTREEMRIMLTTWPATLDTRWRPLLVVAAFCGLRSSELRALEWDDLLNLESSSPVLRVRQRADAKGKIGSTKSMAGQRTIPLSPMVADVLLEWRGVCPRLKLDSTSRLLYVFPNGNGRIENHSNLANRGWKELQRQSGVTRIEDDDGQPVEKAKYGVHSLRHFFTSICIDQGMDVKRLQELLGHSTIQMTLDTYSHLFPREADVRAKLGEAAASVLVA